MKRLVFGKGGVLWLCLHRLNKIKNRYLFNEFWKREKPSRKREKSVIQSRYRWWWSLAEKYSVVFTSSLNRIGFVFMCLGIVHWDIFREIHFGDSKGQSHRQLFFLTEMMINLFLYKRVDTGKISIHGTQDYFLKSKLELVCVCAGCYTRMLSLLLYYHDTLYFSHKDVILCSFLCVESYCF